MRCSQLWHHTGLVWQWEALGSGGAGCSIHGYRHRVSRNGAQAWYWRRYFFRPIQCVAASTLLGSPDLDPAPMCLTRAEWKGKITCLDLFATAFLMQPRTLLTFLSEEWARHKIVLVKMIPTGSKRKENEPIIKNIILLSVKNSYMLTVCVTALPSPPILGWNHWPSEYPEEQGYRY